MNGTDDQSGVSKSNEAFSELNTIFWNNLCECVSKLKVSPMQVTLEPFPASDVGSPPVVIDTTPKSTIATLISSYCAIHDVTYSKKWEIVDEKERALPHFSTLASLGVTDGQKLRIRCRKTSFLSKEKWPLLIALIALVICVAGILIISMIYGLTGGKYLDDYGVVMDAGSSKTNTILYTWKSNKHKGTGCVKQDRTCLVEGGIAEMNPMKLDPVINCAKDVSSRVDPKARSQTPLFFAATAGMRLKNLTNPEKVDEIIEQLNLNLTKTDLSVRAIEVISGDDEGIYGWIASNFLQKTLEIPLKDPWVPTTYGALDMGGASMQISHALPEKQGKDLPGVKPLLLYDQTHYLYSLSNLCFGRKEAERRYRNLLIKSLSETNIEDPCSPADFVYNVTAIELIDQPCTQSKRFEDDLKKNPDLINNIFTFTGTSKPLFCKGNVSKLLDNDLCKQYGFHECFRRTNSGNSEKEKFLAFATYYFTTAFLNVTKSSLDEYVKAAESFCQKNKDEVEKYTKKDFGKQYCFNSQYIYEALITGFNFTKDTWKNIEFVGKIEGIDVGWTLGYMINATNIIPEKEKTPKLISATALALGLVVFILIVIGAVVFILRSRDRNYGSV